MLLTSSNVGNFNRYPRFLFGHFREGLAELGGQDLARRPFWTDAETR